MSVGDDVFARWSRRKLAARQDRLAERSPERTNAAFDAESSNARPVDAEPFGAELVEPELVEAEPGEARPDTDPVEAGTPEPLPRLEDLDAGSDLSAFLRKGVPAALRNSALRRMWSLDPAIRDYVGPAEYAWDFNTPGSMPGFGPLEPNSSVVDFLSTVGRSVLPGDEEALKMQAPAAEHPADPLPSDEGTSAAPESIAEAAVGDSPAEAEPMLARLTPEVAAGAEALSGKQPAPAESPGKPARPRHGSALPR